MAKRAVKITTENVSKSVPLNILRIPIGIFFFILGLCGVIRTIDEGPFSLAPGSSYGVLEILFGIAEIAAGVIILAGLITILSRKTMKLVSLLVLVFWLSRIAVSKFVFGLARINNGADFTIWLLVLAAEAIIAAALYIFYRSYPSNT
ncbi:MAG: hypothetical protein JW904_02135 [Spirochaetales bacterium]|nr:hypothetical protein [Spirochaetales bacterium]